MPAAGRFRRYRSGRVDGRLWCMAAATEATDDLLRPPRERVSPRAIRYWTARVVVLWTVLIALQVVWLLSTDEGRYGPHHVFVALSVLVGGVHALVMPRW